MTDYRQLALDCGYTVAAELNVAALQFLDEVRAMCAADKCQRYGHSWACPPACGEIAHWRAQAARYGKGVLLQTVGAREDSYDFEAMMAVERENRAHGEALIDRILAQKLDCLFLSAGSCTRCETCTYPDAPCRFPERLHPSMEACGLFVSQVCKDSGVPYYYGEDKIAYTSCLLYND